MAPGVRSRAASPASTTSRERVEPLRGARDLPGRAKAGPVSAQRVSFRFMARHPAHWIALGFGSGLAPRAPGTVGTLWGWVAFLAIERWFAPGALGWGVL